VSAHIAIRPTWICAGCGQDWPCATRRAELRAEYTRSAVSLGLYLSSCHAEAAADLRTRPAGELHHRFLGWARGFVPGNKSKGLPPPER
jgi:hypothetical protein